MAIQFLDDTDLPEGFFDVPRKTYRSKYDAFAEALRTNPGRWAELPTDKPLTLEQAKTRRGLLRTGKKTKVHTPPSFRTGVWEAEVHLSDDGQAHLYVRYMGEKQ